MDMNTIYVQSQAAADFQNSYIRNSYLQTLTQCSVPEFMEPIMQNICSVKDPRRLETRIKFNLENKISFLFIGHNSIFKFKY